MWLYNTVQLSHCIMCLDGAFSEICTDGKHGRGMAVPGCELWWLHNLGNCSPVTTPGLGSWGAQDWFFVSLSPAHTEYGGVVQTVHCVIWYLPRMLSAHIMALYSQQYKGVEGWVGDILDFWGDIWGKIKGFLKVKTGLKYLILPNILHFML